MKRNARYSIRFNYIRKMLLLFIIVVIANIAVYWYIQQEHVKLLDQREELKGKQTVFDIIQENLNDMFLRARGYYAFENQNELSRLYEDIGELKGALQESEALSLNPRESNLVRDLNNFIANYEQNTLPTAIRLVKDGDYTGLQLLSESGVNTSVNQLNDFVTDMDKAIDADLEQLAETIFNDTTRYSILMISFILFLFSLVSILIWQTVKGIVKPLELMRESADRFASGEGSTFVPLKRNDEIGILSYSFSNMISTIQEKENELTGYNEELLQQQESLEEGQNRLRDSLEETQQTKEQLEQYNALNQVISFKLNKQEVFQNVLTYLSSVYKLDSGLIRLPLTSEMATRNMTTEMLEVFEHKNLAYVEKRLQEEPYFMIQSESPYQSGFSSPNAIYEMYASMENETRTCITMVGISRIGVAFTENEMKEIHSLLSNVNLAIDRIQLYEEAIHERTLNQHIVDTINEGVQFVSKNGDLLQANHAFLQLYGYSSKSLANRMGQSHWLSKVTEFTKEPKTIQQFFCSCINESEHGSNQMRYTILKPEEKVIDMYSAPVILHGEKLGTVFVHRDITQQYEVDKMKTELVSTVSHELRTPLSSVLGFTELLMHKELAPKKQQKYLGTIHKEAKRLTNLINHFLDLQKMESGNLSYKMEEVSMSEIALETISSFSTLEKHDITLIDKTGNGMIYADKERLAQVMTNVLSNAIKFSPDGGNIKITLKNEGNQLTMSVHDSGIGIPAEALPKLFSKFQRVDNSEQRKIGGTGLGLAICREIIHAHSGEIWIDSEKGLGTTVSFSIPVQADQQLDSPVNESTFIGSVIIVEDDMSMALLLSEELKQTGFKVMYHTNPLEAYQEAKKSKVSSIVIDIMLGDEMNGWDLVNMLKNDEETKHIKVIMSSALDPATASEKAGQVDNYLVKPYPPKHLSQAIMKHLKQPNKDSVLLYPNERQHPNEK